MPGRKYSTDKYRYGFNGKENDNEVKGEGNQQDYGFRISDTRIGRFLSIDPLTNKYPELTSYQFSSNTPIWASDIDGLEARIRTIYSDANGATQVKVENAANHTWKEWKMIKSALFGGIGWTDNSSGFKWIGGYKYYNNNRLQANNIGGYNGPDGGTLTIDSRGKVANISFEYDKPQQGPKAPTFGESIKAGWGGFKYIWNDPGVTEVRNNTFEAAITIFSAGSLQYGKLAWSAAFSNEVAKKTVAARGDLRQVDWFDAITSTIANKMGFSTIGKIGAEIVNAGVDVKADDQVVSLAFVNKENSMIFLDLTFSYFKVLVGDISKATGATKPSEENMKILFDQMKTSTKDAVKLNNTQ